MRSSKVDRRKRNIRLQSRGRRGLRVESLENRYLLTSATWDASTSTLTVEGDTGNNIGGSAISISSVNSMVQVNGVSSITNAAGGLASGSVQYIDVIDPGGTNVINLAGVSGAFTSLVDGVRVIGSDGNDYVTGSPFDDFIVGNGGNDSLSGRDGEDALDGGDTYGAQIQSTNILTSPTSGPGLDEASGVVMSRVNEGVLWIIDDEESHIYVNQTDGSSLGSYPTDRPSTQDWEDIAAIGSTLYILENGPDEDDTARIYRLTEPPVPTTSGEHGQIALTQWIDVENENGGQWNFETLMVDHNNRLFLVSRGDGPGSDANHPTELFEVDYVPWNAWTNNSLVDMNNVGEIIIDSDPTGVGGSNEEESRGGDISPDGSAIAITTEEQIFYWSRNPATQSVADVLVGDNEQRRYDLLPEPAYGDGENWEGITWNAF